MYFKKVPSKKPTWLVPPLVAILCFSMIGCRASDQSKAPQDESYASTSAGMQKVQEHPVTSVVETAVGSKTKTPAQVYAENVGAVAGIRTESTTTNIFGQPSTGTCSGSGFVVTGDGYVVTNYHVVEGARSITVSLHSGADYPAKLIGGYADNDVALLKIEGEDLQHVTIAGKDDLVVGEQIVAIGNPLGELTYSMTVGYVSALDRQINAGGRPINMLQTDVAINSGNSGGPVFDMNGNVIAIASAKYSGRSGTGAYVEGLSFAIPIQDVLDILYDLEAYGYVTGRPYLGIGVREMDRSISEIYGLPAGVMVVSVEEGSCAQKAGIQTGDVLIALGDHEIGSYNELMAALRMLRAGDRVTGVLYRAGDRMEVTIILDEKNTQPVQPDRGAST